MARFDNVDTTNTQNVAALQPGVDVNLKAATIARDEQTMAREVLGLAMDEGQQFFVNGTKMLSCGEATAMNLRKQYEEEPTVGEAMDKFIGQIKAEDRKDYTAPVKNLWIDKVGVLQGANGGVLLTENGYTQLVNNFRGTGAADVPVRLRNNVNLWAYKSEKFAMLRTRNPQPNGVRVGYAAVGSRYGACDLDEIAAMVADAMPKDAHATTLYKDAHGTINVSLAPTYNVEELGVGRLHRVIASISSADDGTERIRVRYKAQRIRCINCTTLMDNRLVFARKHVGDSVKEIFQLALYKAGEAMEIFSAKWREANEKAILDKNDGSALSAEETFKRLVAHGYITVGGIKKPLLVSKLMDAFHAEPGAGAAHINMAITRLAHEGLGSWKSPWIVEDLEEQAGNLLFQSVYVLKALSTEQEEAFAA